MGDTLAGAAAFTLMSELANSRSQATRRRVHGTYYVEGIDSTEQEPRHHAVGLGDV